MESDRPRIFLKWLILTVYLRSIVLERQNGPRMSKITSSSSTLYTIYYTILIKSHKAHKFQHRIGTRRARSTQPWASKTTFLMNYDYCQLFSPKRQIQHDNKYTNNKQLFYMIDDERLDRQKINACGNKVPEPTAFLESMFHCMCLFVPMQLPYMSALIYV